MAKKEEGPLEYERRVLDTKGVAQRLILAYLKRPAEMLVLRKKATWILVAVAAAACVPLVLGLGGKRALSTGPLSASHAAFEKRCEVCHSQAFSKVPDQACEKCHDGAAHPANIVDTAKANFTVRCGECHVEHGGQAKLAMVDNANCTQCHANLEKHASGVQIKGLKVTAFREEKHPEFLTASLKDTRPFQLNHDKHMKADPKKFPRIMKDFMKCVDCHKTDLNSRTGDLIPMTFEASCKSCHKRELQFDRYQVLGEAAMESPHTRDQNTIRQFIQTSYRDALAANPGLASRPLGFDNGPQPNADAWMAKVTNDSFEFLFGQKCTYCHKMESQYEVMKVDPRPPQSPTAPVQAPLGIKGRYPDGKDWFERSEFSHRAHREVECESCHAAAKTSTKTEDVLIPVMKSCLPCHGENRASLDRCAECHLYHNRSLEKERDRRPTDKIIGWSPGKVAQALLLAAPPLMGALGAAYPNSGRLLASCCFVGQVLSPANRPSDSPSKTTGARRGADTPVCRVTPAPAFIPIFAPLGAAYPNSGRLLASCCFVGQVLSPANRPSDSGTSAGALLAAKVRQGDAQ